MVLDTPYIGRAALRGNKLKTCIPGKYSEKLLAFQANPQPAGCKTHIIPAQFTDIFL
jgi:hypothetical protein